MKKMSLIAALMFGVGFSWMISAQDTGSYAASGRFFYNFLSNDINATMENVDMRPYLSKYLDKLEFPEEIRLDFADEKGLGDASWFYLLSDHDLELKEAIGDDRLYESALRNRFHEGVHLPAFDPSSAWQFYLLYNASTVMPFFWHEGYNCRDYVFSADDMKENLKRIRIYNDDSLDRSDAGSPVKVDSFTEGYDFSPKVAVNENTAVISCYYWNDWKGLVHETVEIEVSGMLVSSYIRLGEEIVYQYDCGIMY